jgi:hypothetical protein
MSAQKIMTPYELANFLELGISSFLASSPEGRVEPKKLHRYFNEKKRENPDKYKELIFSADGWSDNLELALNSLEKGGVVRQTEGYVMSTALGRERLAETKTPS